MRIQLLAILLMLSGSMIAQSAHQHLRQGDRAYRHEAYDLSEESYRKALEKTPDTKGSFNLGNSIYQQERYEEAVQHYEQSIEGIGDPEARAEALYNLGNAQLKSGQLEDAIESYKKAIRLNPNDEEIRQNLYIAKLLKKEQQQQQQQQQQQEQQNQDQQQQNQENQQEQDQQQQEQQQEQQQSSDSNVDPSESDDEQKAEPQDLSKEDALKLLKVIENEEKNVQEKLRKISGKKKKPKKDW